MLRSARVSRWTRPAERLWTGEGCRSSRVMFFVSGGGRNARLDLRRSE